MKSAMAMAALVISACTGSTAEPISPPRGLSAVADSCAAGRPDFWAVATEADPSVFAYDVNAPLNVQKLVESTNNGVEVSAISFNSPGGGRVTGLLLDPITPSNLRPGIVIMHGIPGNTIQTVNQAQLLAELGAVVIVIDAQRARHSGGQIRLIKDLQRAVDVLHSRPNVDDERIAYLGISHGGAVGARFVGIERRLKAAVLVVGDGGPVTHMTGPEDLRFMAGLSCATRVRRFRAMAPIEAIRFIPHASPTTLLLQNGQLDTWYPRPMRSFCTQPSESFGRSAGLPGDTGSINGQCSIGWIGCTWRLVSSPGSNAVSDCAMVDLSKPISIE